MRRALLIVWLATIGADRVDFFGGKGGFVLTPFLCLAPVVIAAELLELLRSRRRIVVPGSTPIYFVAVTALLCVAVLSTLLGSDLEMSSKRSMLLTFQVYSTFVIAILILSRRDREPILAGGAYLGLALALAFNVVLVSVWTAGLRGGTIPEAGGIVDLTAASYAGLIPRLSGQVYDQNRGGLLFLVYIFFLLRFGRPSRMRSAFVFLGVLFLLATLSRSAMLGAVTMGVLLLLESRGIALSRPRVAALAAAGMAIAGGLMIYPREMGDLFSTLEPLSERFSLSEGSASIHLVLLQRGWEIGTESARNALIGIGFGNAFTVLQDLFPSNKYANFHSLYISLLVESGVFALTFGLILLLYPLVRGGSFRPLIAGMVLFNVFYHATADPVFWLVLALAWLTLDSVISSAHDAPRARGGRGAPDHLPGSGVPRLPVALAADDSGLRVGRIIQGKL